MSWESDNEALIREETREAKAPGFTITRGRDAHPHMGRSQRGAEDGRFYFLRNPRSN